jgi:formylglycine-generating enzyme required for sulfatase activity
MVVSIGSCKVADESLLGPTKITVHLKTDVPYKIGRELAITAAGPEDVESAPVDAEVEQPWDESGEIGTVVVVPSGGGTGRAGGEFVVVVAEGNRNARVGIRVVMGVARAATSCSSNDTKGCIVARRRLQFIEHRALFLPIGLYAICEGVQCEPGTTCNALGKCVRSEVDESKCGEADSRECMIPDELELPSATNPDGGGSAGTAGSGGAGGSGGTSGAGGTGGSTGGTGGSECGNPTGGPAMVKVAGGFCIDATEVTRSQYQAWLSTSPSTSGQPSYCSWNSDYTPACEWPAGTEGGHPVVCVDWCDAVAYCQGVGKRLCGKIGGGSNVYEDYANEATSQWYNACTSGGQNDYPYGDALQRQACNGYDKGIGTTVETGSLSTCQSSSSGYAGVYDLSGNVSEWEDSCSGNSGSADDCRLRGGSFSVGVYSLRCGYVNYYSRDVYYDVIGFRCCAP